jgi:flagellar basal body-associated protein FliL
MPSVYELCLTVSQILIIIIIIIIIILIIIIIGAHRLLFSAAFSLQSTSHHPTVCFSQRRTLFPAYLYQKDERVLFKKQCFFGNRGALDRKSL